MSVLAREEGRPVDGHSGGAGGRWGGLAGASFGFSEIDYCLPVAPEVSSLNLVEQSWQAGSGLIPPGVTMTAR
jgi:hypothetical protein